MNIYRVDQLTPDVETLFWSLVERRGEDECWPWLGHCVDKGYGRVFHRGTKLVMASHRLAWVIQHRRDIPDGHEICHSCDVEWCQNGKHLFPGTRVDNERDKVSKGRHHWQINREYAVAAAKRGAAKPEHAQQLAEARKKRKYHSASPEERREWAIAMNKARWHNQSRSALSG